MAARIRVQAEGGDLLDGILLVEPLQEIWGNVEVDVDRTVECRSLTVRLLWHTEGRGDQDQETMQEVDLYQGLIEPGYPVQGTFRFRLPSSPWSFSGHYVSIVWAIEVNVDVPMGHDFTHRERLMVRPRAAR